MQSAVNVAVFESKTIPYRLVPELVRILGSHMPLSGHAILVTKSHAQQSQSYFFSKASLLAPQIGQAQSSGS